MPRPQVPTMQTFDLVELIMTTCAVTCQSRFPRLVNDAPSTRRPAGELAGRAQLPVEQPSL